MNDTKSIIYDYLQGDKEYWKQILNRSLYSFKKETVSYLLSHFLLNPYDNVSYSFLDPKILNKYTKIVAPVSECTLLKDDCECFKNHFNRKHNKIIIKDFEPPRNTLISVATVSVQN